MICGVSSEFFATFLSEASKTPLTLLVGWSNSELGVGNDPRRWRLERVGVHQARLDVRHVCRHTAQWRSLTFGGS